MLDPGSVQPTSGVISITSKATKTTTMRLEPILHFDKNSLVQSIREAVTEETTTEITETSAIKPVSNQSKQALVNLVRKSKNLNKNQQANLFIESLVWQICCLHESNPAFRKQLFETTCKLFIDTNVLENSFVEDSLHPLRHMIASGLNSFLSQETTKMRNQLFVSHNSNQIVPSPLTDIQFLNNPGDSLNSTRYIVEFEELSEIARGGKSWIFFLYSQISFLGFGVVKKARHRMDNCIYAVKRISFQCNDKNNILQIIREVQFLASLGHPNVVAYKTAWIEPGSRTRTSSTSLQSPQIVDLNETDYLNCEDSNKSNFGACNESDGFVFESSRKVPCEKREVFSPNRSTTEEEDYDEDEESDEEDEFGSKSNSDSTKNGELPEILFPQSCQLMPVKRTRHLSIGRRRLRAMLFIQMELCGENLRAYLDNRNQEIFRLHLDDQSSVLNHIEIDVELNIFNQLLNGLQYIHSQNLIHRDLKPPNILFSLDRKQVKISDFGLATMRFANHIDINDNVERVSPVGEHTGGLGTSIYAAPEQQMGVNYDQRVDMYSLGIILFELLQPFSTAMERAKMITSLKEKRHLPTDFVRRWPVLAKLILQLTDCPSSQRPKSVGIIFESLDRFHGRNHGPTTDSTAISKDDLLNENRSLRAQLLEKDRLIVELKQQLQTTILLCNPSNH